MANKETSSRSLKIPQPLQHPSTNITGNINRYGWRLTDNTLHAVKFTFDSISINVSNNKNEDDDNHDASAAEDVFKIRKNTKDTRTTQLCQSDNNLMMRPLEEGPQNQLLLHQDTSGNLLCYHCADTINFPRGESTSLSEMQQKMEKNDAASGSNSASSGDGITLDKDNTESISSMRSIGSFVCRICHNAENPERLVSPCLCKGTLTYVHTFCLEHWISTSGKTNCELCQFQYKTIQTLRYTCLQSLRMWYSHSMSRRALQEDCQMFSLLTLVAFGIIGTILVGIQHYFVEERSSNMATIARVWTRGWLLFFLFTTFTVYFINVYMLIRGQLGPWYRWWQSAREIKLILENRKTFHPMRRLEKSNSTAAPPPPGASVEMSTNLQDAQRNTPIAEQAEQEIAIGTTTTTTTTVCLTTAYAIGDNRDAEVGGRRYALVPSSSGSEDTSTIGINNQQGQQEQRRQQQSQQQQQQQQPQNEQPEGQQQDNRDQVAASFIDI